MNRFLLRGLLLVFGASLLPLTGLVYAARREPVEPYYLEFNTPDPVNGGLDTCRLRFYNRPQECGYLDAAWTTSLSPDGRWRVYARGDSVIYRVPFSGSKPQSITQPGTLALIGEQDWSPDGRWLAFSAFEEMGSDLDIFRVEVATGIVQRLTQSAGDEWYPAWSPDSQRIAFNARDSLGTSGLFVMNADGGDQREPLPGLQQSFRPQWSQDGEWLIFQSNCLEVVLRSLGERPCAAAHFDLYRLRLSDGHFESLVALPGDEYDPAWSPDGEWVAFASRIDPASQAGIYRVRPDGSALGAVTDDSRRSYFSPSWARTPNFDWHPLFLLIPALVMVALAWRTKS